jgi:hypothetical protein
MKINIQEKITEIFTSVEIHPEYSPEIINIKNFKWNNDICNFKVEYYVDQTKYVFHFNEQIANEISSEYFSKNPLEQLEREVKYIKRMYERGIGSKDYYPFTHIEKRN